MMDRNLNSRAYITNHSFPYQGSHQDQLIYLIAHATLAPSGHNAQPWKFEIRSNDIFLFADTKRNLSQVDARHREMCISCGAALHHLLTACLHFNLQADYVLFPDSQQNNLLAKITITVPTKKILDEQNDLLFNAIFKRCTYRKPFLNRPLPKELISWLNSHANKECWAYLLNEKDEKPKIVEFIKRGNLQQGKNKHVRRELASWIRPSLKNGTGDGLPTQALNISDSIAFFAPWIIRHFNWGKSQAKKDIALVDNAPQILFLLSKEDDPMHWLQTGMFLSDTLLHAANQNVYASYFNQPNEIPELREEMRRAFNLSGYPQVLMRLGIASDVKPITPRRAIQDILSF